MIDDLLDVVRMRLSKLELSKSPVLVSDVIQQAVESCRPLIEAARHRLEVTLPERPLWVEGEPLRLIQIVSNLLNNAAKYTPEGGQIELHVQNEGTPVVIRVRDTGIGISAAMLPRIFDLYAQGNAAVRERARGGLGIGLSLVQRLVELHGGQITAHSAGLGEGSEFVVTLPLWRAALTTATRNSKSPPPIRPLRILVVDDNRDSADSLGLLLSIDGHTVRTAYDGASALDIARSFRPDVALQDVAMPGMDGYQVASKLRQFPETRDATLIALTGFTSSEDEEAARLAGFDHRLGKPVDFEALVGMLGTL
jgi:two-component system CheB/CheR fusion protein